MLRLLLQGKSLLLHITFRKNPPVMNWWIFLFITYGMRESHMEHFEKECFETEYGVSGIVREKKDSYEPIFIRGTAVGVVLCLFSYTHLTLPTICSV